MSCCPRPWYEKADLSSTDMHPFIHAFSPAIDPPWETRSDFDAFGAIAEAFSTLAAGTWAPAPTSCSAPCSTTPRARWRTRWDQHDWRVEGGAGAREDHGPLAVVERDYPAIADKWITLGPLTEARSPQGHHHPPDASRELAKNGVWVRGQGVRRSPPPSGWPTSSSPCRARPTAGWPWRASASWRRRTGRELAHLAEGSEERRITYADTQARPVPVITSPEWSGSETGGRRYAPFTVNIEQLKPWHTLTGRMHFYLDHDWLEELGEQLPIYRPPLDMARLFGEPAGDDEPGVTVRYLTPHSKWSIHSEYQDNLFMLSLSRGGPTIWMSPPMPRRSAPRQRWIEAVNRNGVVVCRRSSAPHARGWSVPRPGRTIDVPLTETTGRRGGIHNSLTRMLLKPSHLAGGYAQHAWAFNYLGPTGNQRDEVTVIRRRAGGGVLMKVMAQMAMVMNLDKCIGCHTCSVTCKQAWTNRTGTEYVWFNNVETRPGWAIRAPTRTRTAGAAAGCAPRAAEAARRRPAAKLRDLLQPEAAQIDDYYEPWTYDYDNLLNARWGTDARGSAEEPAHRRGHEGLVVGQLGRRPRRLAGDVQATRSSRR
jgi:nitrate reductase alpha subunit